MTLLPAMDAGNNSIPDLATWHGGLNWYANAYCKGIVHFCTSIVKVGGVFCDHANPSIINADDVAYS